MAQNNCCKVDITNYLKHRAEAAWPTSSVITEFIARWNNHFVEQAIFDTGNADEIAEQIDAFCMHTLRSHVADGRVKQYNLLCLCNVYAMMPVQ